MYTKEEILLMISEELKKKDVEFSLDQKSLDTLVLDISRAVDNQLTSSINMVKEDLNVKINAFQSELIRRYFLGYPVIMTLNVESFKPKFTDIDIIEAYDLVNEGFKRNTQLMIDSIIARIKKNYLNLDGDNLNKYIEYINELQLGKEQLVILDVNADDLNTANNIAQIIEEKYESLSNYHYMIVVFRDGEETLTSWKDIADVALFMEQFKKEHNFNVYEKRNKERRINELKEFISTNEHINSSEETLKQIENYYDGVSYGFQFKDLFITNDGEIKTLIMQKVELDETPKKCPSCLESLVRGNSYPRVLYKSFECSNPSCPSRSKVGRGKRFDLYGSKRQMMLERDSELDEIDRDTYNAFRRDILDKDEFTLERLMLLYTWSGDSIMAINTKLSIESYKDREIINESYSKFDNKERIKNTDWYRLFDQIAKDIDFKDEYEIISQEKTRNSLIINGDSTSITPFLSRMIDTSKLSGAVTSPPYYNAREYSQWDTLLCYLIDMMSNAKAVLSSLTPNGTYIYNIGDIVEQDNVFIQSYMSKARQMLGFYSIFIFEMIGFKSTGNIIWDKGEVQSKRNSTANHLSGYVNPVNAYEHCLIFSKNIEKEIEPTRVEKIGAVIKINSKGTNTYGHTAPYPVDIPKLIIPYLEEKDSVVIDPFLGSGTTTIALREEGYNSVGFELNEEYFQLACNRINESSHNLFSLTNEVN